MSVADIIDELRKKDAAMRRFGNVVDAFLTPQPGRMTPEMRRYLWEELSLFRKAVDGDDE